MQIIAEAEINHDGDVALAKRMVESARASGADLIKFQCFPALGFIAPGPSFLPLFQKFELDLEDLRAIRDHARTVGLPMISTAGDLDGLRMIVELDLPVVKVGFLIAVTDIPAGAVIEPRMLRPRRIDVSKAPDPALLLGPEAEQRALGFRTARAIPSGAVLDVGSVDFAAGRSPGR